VSTARLLLIDDDPSTRETLAALLEDEGYELELASNAEEALESLRTGRFAFVLLDWHLRDVVGSTLLPSIEEHQPAARTIVVTGEPRDVEGFPGIAGVHQKTDAFVALLRLLQ